MTLNHKRLIRLKRFLDNKTLLLLVDYYKKSEQLDFFVEMLIKNNFNVTIRIVNFAFEQSNHTDNIDSIDDTANNNVHDEFNNNNKYFDQTVTSLSFNKYISKSKLLHKLNKKDKDKENAKDKDKDKEKDKDLDKENMQLGGVGELTPVIQRIFDNGTWESEKRLFLNAEEWQMKQCSFFGISKEVLEAALKRFIEKIENQDHYVAVMGLSADENGKIVGNQYPNNGFDGSIFEMRYKHKVRGDKFGVFITKTYQSSSTQEK